MPRAPLLSLLMATLLCSIKVYGQNGNYLLKPARYCSFTAENVEVNINITQTDPPDANMLGEIEQLFNGAGLFWSPTSQYVYLIRDYDIPNCKAFSLPLYWEYPALGWVRYISYNPNYLESVRLKTGSDFAVTSILAHELSHHLYGHLDQETSNRHFTELQADYFSGYILAKMKNQHLSLEEATRCLRMFADSLESDTHPSRELRLQYFTNGWNYSMKVDSLSCLQYLRTLKDRETFMQNLIEADSGKLVQSLESEVRNNIGEDQQESIEKSVRVNRRRAEAMLIIPNDPQVYLVTKDSAVSIANRKGRLPRNADPAFSLKMDSTLIMPKGKLSDDIGVFDNNLHIDRNNLIWSRLPNGIPYIIGIKETIK